MLRNLWLRSEEGMAVMALVADARPAWIWAADGTLRWRNRAALLQGGKLKKSGVHLALPAEPIKGQVTRTLRLSLEGQFTPGRLQFLVGGRPQSTTCACRALHLPEGLALLVVAEDPIDRDLLKSGQDLETAAVELELFGPPAASVLIDRKGRIIRGTGSLGKGGRKRLAALLEDAGEEPVTVDANGAKWTLARFRAGPRGERLGLLTGDINTPAQPDYGRGQDTIEGLIAADEQDDLLEAEPLPETTPERPAPPDAVPAPKGSADAGRSGVDAAPDGKDPDRLWRIVASAVRRHVKSATPGAPPDLIPANGLVDAETVDRVSRYNFDELSRILTDRVSAMGSATPQAADAIPAESREEGELVAPGGEAFILNRLPLGLLIFRDQSVLFANRAFTELTGYDSGDALRQAGLSAVFPAEDGAGPTTRLVRQDGHLVTVDARLNSISWAGKPALMMAVLAVDPQAAGHEGAVRRFAELEAELAGDGFVLADASGTVTSVNVAGRGILAAVSDHPEGQPLAGLVDSSALTDLHRFLELPARFAETPRPALRIKAAAGQAELILFAEGQAGIVSGYFGTVRRLGVPQTRAVPDGARDEDMTATLGRLSRGIRRPLNTVIGFAEIIASTPGSGTDPRRVAEYARDIRTAGQEIALLVEELDDYARLRDGRYAARSDEIDLADLLNHCLARVKGQAAEARVLVRSAVSERLPHITADKPSLTQAVLNLLASAIDETRTGGTVILSAQRDEAGGVLVNVRDTSDSRTELGERFVVFRDGVGKDGEQRSSMRSSVGLALTRSLLAVNALKLEVDPTPGVGTIFSLYVPRELARG